jgi:hypothetical protein
VFHWTRPFPHPAYPEQLKYVGPFLAPFLPALQYPSLYLQFAVSYPYQAYLLLDLFPRLFQPIGAWNTPYSNASRLLLEDSGRYAQRTGILEDAAVMLAVIVAAWAGFAVVVLVRWKVRSKLMTRLYQAFCLAVCRANSSFSFILLGHSILTLKSPSFSSALSIANFIVSLLYLIQLASLLVWTLLKLYWYEAPAELLFFSSHCRYEPREELGCRVALTPPFFEWYRLALEVTSFTLFWAFPSTPLAQLPPIALTQLTLLLLLPLTNPFHHNFFTLLQILHHLLTLSICGLVLFFHLYYARMVGVVVGDQTVLDVTGWAMGVVGVCSVAVGVASVVGSGVFFCRQGGWDVEVSMGPYLAKEET